MCLAALALGHDPRYPFVVAANRDEFHARPAAPLAWWQPDESAPPILAGRDLQAGGTWMGVTAEGRFAFVTNVRIGPPPPAGGPSRGAIVPRWLRGDLTPQQFGTEVARSGTQRHNHVFGDLRSGEFHWGSSETPDLVRIAPGITGLSNAAALDPPWPKVANAKQRLAVALAASQGVDDLADRLFAALADRKMAPEAALPDTGIAPEVERMLSAIFIRSADGGYGTRSSTVLIGEAQPQALRLHVIERNFAADGTATVERRTSLDLPA